MKLKILLFAGLTEHFGNSVLNLEIREPSVTVERLKQVLTERYPGSAAIISQSFIAKNQTYAADGEPVEEKDELALIPPVFGG